MIPTAALLSSFLLHSSFTIKECHPAYEAGILFQRAQINSVFSISTHPDSEKDTRIKFPDFEVIFYNFRAYDTELSESGDLVFFSYFAMTNSDEAAFLVRSDSSDEEYIQTSNDTLILSEDLDERINNTLLEIVPVYHKDQFRVNMYYESTLGQIIDDREMTYQERDSAWEQVIKINEHTPPIHLPDSARYFFRAAPHTPDMIEVTVKDGEIVPVSFNNTEEQIKKEQAYDEQEWERIKTKYALHDTLVEIPGEYITIAPLTDGKKLYGYGYDYYVFEIQRLQNQKIIETVYIRIGIAYGC